MRQQRDRYETVLLLATQQQGKLTLYRRFQSIGPVVKMLTPPSSSPIPWTRHISSADASVVVVEALVLIFIRLRLHCRCRSLRPVVDPPTPLPLSLIPQTRCIFLVLCRRLRFCSWVLGPVFLFRRHHICLQYPGTVNTLPPLPLETFTQARRLFFLLCRRLSCCCWVIGIILLCQRLRCCRQFLRTVIATL